MLSHPCTASETPLSIGQSAALACLLEAAAPKPGNVHPGASFTDMTFGDLAVSAIAIAPAMDAAQRQGVGATVLAARQATARLVSANTNLGIVLLLAPLAAVPPTASLRSGVRRVLRRLTAQDAADVYAAIRQARAGGLGVAAEMDVAHAAPDRLLEAMAAAGPRDLVARQYVEGFAIVLEQITPWIVAGRTAGWTLDDAIVYAHVRSLATWPDTLIARKCGPMVAEQASARARHVLANGGPGDMAYDRALKKLDDWLRGDGHRRNPGATADLIAASLFAALRDRRLDPSSRRAARL